MSNEYDNFPWFAYFLLRVLNYIFPPLLKKSLEFYKWYFATCEPTERLYGSRDLRDLARSLGPLRKDNDSVQLAEWLQHQPIADAVAVMDAIRMRIEQAQQQPNKLPGHPDGCVEAVRYALLELARRLDEQGRKKPSPETRRRR